MRLHRLELRAFGPFRDTQVVDFEQLSDAGLFLLTGDTGAGKTSVLDAVAYALYGQIPGGRESAMRVRSDHAAPETRTRVQLELSVRGQRLRVTRTPDWDRPKKRGPGITREKGKVLLERHSGDWELVSSRHDEVGHELGRLLGMTCEQFCQVVLLPQGDFAKFLEANAETRKHLLERLFGTERFSAVEQWLSAESATRGTALASARESVAGVLASLRQLDHTSDHPAPDALIPGRVVVDWGERVAAELVERLLDVEAVALRATDEVATQRRALDSARAVADRQRQLADLVASRARLLEDEPVVAAVEAEISAARHVRRVEPLLSAVDEAADAFAAADAIRAEALAAVVDNGAVESNARVDATSLARLERATRDDMARFADLVDDELRRDELADEIADLSADLVHLTQTAERAEARLADAPADRGRLDSHVVELRARAATVPDLRAGADALSRRVRAARRRDLLTAEVVAARAASMAAIEAAQDARERSLSLYERRLAGIAAELAASLQPGGSCPVCGSAEHPHPAPPATDHVTEVAELAARAATRIAETRRDEAESLWVRLTQERADAAVEAGGEDALTLLDARETDLADDLAAALAAAAALDEAEAALARHDSEVARVATLADTTRTSKAEVAGRRDSLARELAAIERRLVKALGGTPTIAARQRELATRAELLGAAVRAIERHEIAAAASAAAEKKASAAATRAGFADLRAAALAVRDESHLVDLQVRVDEHRARRAVVDAGLARADLADLPTEPADVGRAALAVDEAEAAERKARLDLGWLRPAASQAAALVADLRATVARVEPLQRAYETVDGLARLAAGGSENRLRMRLSYYVLSARLEQVAEAASERLLRMSDGRFSLVHTDERSPGNQRSGLGLRVRDGWYATDRDPATLSGGESFMASLALALGLADIVTAEAGGTSMDTLFVDEGFGGLDTDTLDAVLDVLDGLRAGGRSVGLVSHVAELRTRIPVQLGVRRAREGSTLAVIA